jgi:hypothetical protein
MANKKFDSLYDRIMSKVYTLDWQNENGCWLYGGRLDKDGYGRMNVRIDGRHITKRTHQVVWEEIEKKPLPAGLTLDHLEHCIAKACCNYDHLELVTRSVNSKRRWERARA